MHARAVLLALLCVAVVAPRPVQACDALDGFVDGVVTDLHGTRLGTMGRAIPFNPCSRPGRAQLAGGLAFLEGFLAPGEAGHAVDWQTGQTIPLPAWPGPWTVWNGAWYGLHGQNVTRMDLVTGRNETWLVPGIPEQLAHGVAAGLGERLRAYDLEARTWIIDRPVQELPPGAAYVLAVSHSWAVLQNANATQSIAVRLPSLQETARWATPWGAFAGLDGNDTWFRLEDRRFASLSPEPTGWMRVHLSNGTSETGPANSLLDVQGGHLLFADTGRPGGQWQPVSAPVQAVAATSPPPPSTSAKATGPAPGPALAFALGVLCALRRRSRHP